jgi:hypothetical protein
VKCTMVQAARKYRRGLERKSHAKASWMACGLRQIFQRLSLPIFLVFSRTASGERVRFVLRSILVRWLSSMALGRSCKVARA